jgi:hypothetical protein
MSPGGAASKAAPVGWAILDRHHDDAITIRWQRGESVAYVLSGRRIGDHGMTDVLDTVPVSPSGWADLAELRLTGKRWLRQQ